jgi:hypothetical protein
MKIKAGMTAYNFECLDRASIQECFESGGPARLRELVDQLREDVETLERLTEAIEAGATYRLSHERICTWWGWG